MVEGGMGAGHFIFIPAVLLVGVVIGWILGSRAARDAFAAELRRRESRAESRYLIMSDVGCWMQDVGWRMAGAGLAPTS